MKIFLITLGGNPFAVFKNEGNARIYMHQTSQERDHDIRAFNLHEMEILDIEDVEDDGGDDE